MVSKCSARCSESNDILHGGVGHSRRELARSGQVRVGSGQVCYQNVQLKELNPMMYHTWGWGYGNPPYHEKASATENTIIFID